MFALINHGKELLNTEKEEKFIKENYPKAENISIDYGILEKAENVYVKRAGFDWNDLGTWGALSEKLQKEGEENTVVNAETLLMNSKNNMIFTSEKKLVVLEDLNDYIVVDKKEVLMIVPKEKEQEIKEILNRVKTKFDSRYS